MREWPCPFSSTGPVVSVNLYPLSHKAKDTAGWCLHQLVPFKQAHQEKERTQINTIRNERGEITTDTTEIQRIVRNYYKELCKKFEKLGEIDKFLEKYNLPKLNEEAESLNRPVTADEIETVIKKVPIERTKMVA